MITIHKAEIENNVILSKEEFKMILENLRKIDKIEIVEIDDPDYLTDEELEQLEIAEEEVKKGETVSFKNVKEKWFKGESVNVWNGINEKGDEVYWFTKL